MSEYITTYTGIHFKPTEPEPELIRVEDIAHALSMICRGNGHVHTFWSVAEHCICCAKEAAARGLPDRMVLACLLHDASECYMSDVPTPFKKQLPEYEEREERLLRMIYEKFLGSALTEEEQEQLDEIDHALVLYDLEVLLKEKQQERSRSFALSWIIRCVRLMWRRQSICRFSGSIMKIYRETKEYHEYKK